MFSQIFSNPMEFLINSLLILPTILISLSIHELSHGYVAYKLGDPTAKQMGRLTLNPLAHLDVIGTIMIFLVGFGFAKPVPVNPMYFKKRKAGLAIVSFAGPLSNFLLAFIGMGIYLWIRKYNVNLISNPYVDTMLQYFIIINVSLGIFNLIPISPLDGSKILLFFFPDRIYYKVLEYERYAQGLIFILLLTGILSKPLMAAVDFILKMFSSFWNFIF